MGASESSEKAVIIHHRGDDMPIWALVVIDYCDWQTRSNAMMLSKRWWSNCNTLEFFRYLSNRLSDEHGIYCPPIPPTGQSWRSLFLELYQMKSLWEERPLERQNPSHLTNFHERSEDEKSKICVYAKFRPLKISSDSGNLNLKEGSPEDSNEIQVTLPLHQRLSMIKMSRKLKNNQEALKVLTSEGGWFKKKWSSLVNQQTSENDFEKENSPENNQKTNRKGISFESNQKIPKFAKDLYQLDEEKNLVTKKKGPGMSKQDLGTVSANVQSVDPLTGRVVMVAPDVGLREFTFDGVLPSYTSQKATYDLASRRLVMDFLNGFNATAIVYGQTGSGKTYTMFGKDNESIYGQKKEGKGIIPRAMEEIFQAVEKRRVNNGIEAELAVSYVEIYGEQVSDLLRFGARCGRSSVAAQRYVLSGAAEQIVKNMKDVYEILEQGENQKRRAATAMNDRSTRAHSLFLITLNQKKRVSKVEEKEVTIKSRLFLADLGGSEKVEKSQVEAGRNLVFGANQQFSVGFQLGTHMREAVYINLGLLALKKCIESLNLRAPYVPYQDSKLTMLLSEGLGGNSKTSVIICGNMDPKEVTETVATLRFGEKCAQVETAAARNQASMLASVLAKIDSDIANLEKEIKLKERWEMREEKRNDDLAEEGTIEQAMGGVEVRKAFVLVGAEKERQLLQDLLIRRENFIGSKGLEGGEEEGEKENGDWKKVVGFGKEYAELYGLGGKFDEEAELNAENTRFTTEIQDITAVPITVRAHKGAKTWATGGVITEEDEGKLEIKAKKAKRSKLAYSGISA